MHVSSTTAELLVVGMEMEAPSTESTCSAVSNACDSSRAFSTDLREIVRVLFLSFFE